MHSFRRQLTGQWLSNCTKSKRGPRWLQKFNQTLASLSEAAEPVGPSETRDTAHNSREVDEELGALYQGRANSAKELFSAASPHKDDILARAGQLIAECRDAATGGADIRHWRRALEDVWAAASDEVRQSFMDKAAVLAARVQR